MKNAFRLMLAASAAVVLTAAAHADVTLNSVRVVAKDSEALGKFYEAAFGMKETNRLATASGPELFLNFGATVEAAKGNTHPRIVIMQNPAPAADPVMHVIFTVTDATATAAAAKAAGGTVDREPTVYGNTGIVIAFVVPEGNHIELIQPAAR
jgi:predicted enzyme related to lactoylglutathione lyase